MCCRGLQKLLERVQILHNISSKKCGRGKGKSLLHMLYHLTFGNYFVMISFSGETLKSGPVELGLWPSPMGPLRGGHRTLSPPGLCRGWAPPPGSQMLTTSRRIQKRLLFSPDIPTPSFLTWKNITSTSSKGGEEARSLGVESEDSSQTWVQILVPLLTS